MSVASSNTNSWNTEYFSNSVNRVLREVEEMEEVTGEVTGEATFLQLVNILFSKHPEYGHDILNSYLKQGEGEGLKFKKFIEQFEYFSKNPDSITFEKLTAGNWAGRVLGICSVPAEHVIDGRLFLFTVLVSQYYGYENKSGERSANEEERSKNFLFAAQSLAEQLENELKIGDKIIVDEYLTKEGKKMRESFYGREKEQSKQEHQAKNSSQKDQNELTNLADRPAKKDLLSRDAMALYLANRLRYIYPNQIKHIETINGKKKKESYSFFMHIDGEWGSGKSTLLWFLKKHLEKFERAPNADIKPHTVNPANEDNWIVVDFNAWQNQRLDPPWWYIMKSVFFEISSQLRKRKKYREWLSFIFKEYSWRINKGTNYLYAVLITLLLFGYSIYAKVVKKEEWESLPVIQVLTFIGFLWSLTKSIRTSLVGGSSKSARAFIEENGSDPMNILAKHFKSQIENIREPVAILIDDLDRCNRDYGIKLLEGLQTIFKDAPVVYVIAADRKWLRTIYESQYSMFASVISKPAKPFGLVFLDKTFQLIIELPSISSLQKSRYLKSILNEGIYKDKDIEEKRKRANEQINTVSNNEELFALETKADDEVEKQILREQVLSSISIGVQEDEIKHTLEDFIELMEPNPREIKRIINDISITKGITYLYDQEVTEQQLILWTILKIRHPLLADFFWNNPDKVEYLFSVGADTKVLTGDKELDNLLMHDNVKRILRYPLKDPNAMIDADFIYKMKFEKRIPVVSNIVKNQEQSL